MPFMFGVITIHPMRINLLMFVLAILSFQPFRFADGTIIWNII
jgi:hypothetical protein